MNHRQTPSVLRAQLSRWAGLIFVAVIAAAALWYLLDDSDSGELRETAMFTSATGIYAGDDVRILGATVGSVESVTPTSAGAKVVFTVDSQYKVPAGVKVALISPTLVSSRYLQLAPAYSTGPTLADNQVIGSNRTAIPLEFPQVEQELTNLANALGPSGTNSAGALNQLLVTADKNLSGNNAQLLHDTLTRLPQAVAALDNSKGDLFQTIVNLGSFIQNLNDNEVALTQFSTDLQGASQVLAQNREEVSTALTGIDHAFAAVTTFLHTNEPTVKQTLVSLTQLSQTLAYANNGLAQVLHVAPTALDNLYNIIDPRYNALTGRFALSNFGGSPAALVCGLIESVTPSISADALATACKTPVDLFTNLLGITNGTGILPGPSSAIAGSPASSATATTPAATTGTSSPVGSIGALLQQLLGGSGS